MTTEVGRTGAACVFVTVTAAYLAAFAANCLGLDGKYSPDSVVYINAAGVFLKTGALGMSSCQVSDALRKDVLPPLPMGAYGPLYPLMIAALTPVMKPAAAALVAALLGYVLLFPASFLLMRRLAGTGAALLGTAALLHLQPLSFVAVHAWSETVALACLTVCLLLLLHAREGGRVAAFGAGIAAGLTCLTRPAMVPLAPVGLVVLFRRAGLRRCAGDAGLFLCGFLLFAFPVLLPRESDLPIFATSRNLFQGLVEMGNALRSGFMPQNWLVPWLYLLLVLAALGWRVWMHRSTTAGQGRVSLWPAGMLALWAAAYLAFLAYTRSRMFIDAIGDRLAVPATFALLLFAVLLFAALLRPPFWLCAVFALAIAGSAALPQLRSAEWLARANLPPVYDFALQRRQWETLGWLENHTGPDDVIIAEEGMDLPLFLGPVRVLFFYSPDAASFTTGDLGRLLDRHRDQFEHAYLVLKPPGEEHSPDPAAAGVNACRFEPHPLARLKDGVIIALGTPGQARTTD